MIKPEGIQPNELRIGNWYIGASRGEYEQVDANVIYHLANNKMNCLPIQLSPAILEKCGFEKVQEDDWVRFIKGIKYQEDGSYTCDLELDQNEDGTWTVDYHDVIVQYLHTLQNVHFALTQTELTFKP